MMNLTLTIMLVMVALLITYGIGKRHGERLNNETITKLDRKLMNCETRLRNKDLYIQRHLND